MLLLGGCCFANMDHSKKIPAYYSFISENSKYLNFTNMGLFLGRDGQPSALEVQES
jgi:hypothetical protein